MPVGQVHLLPDARNLIGVDPFIVARAADIVIMIINAVAAATPRLIRLWQPAQVAPVVIAQQQRHIIGHAHAFVEIFLHLLIQRPYLRRLFRGFAGDLGDDAALIFDDLFEQGDVGLFAHGLIAIAAHADGDQTFIVAHSRNPLAPEGLQGRLVFSIVPGTMAELRPFGVRTHQRLVMRSADDHSVFIGQGGISWVIHIKSAAPHGRPEEISFQPQDQLKHLFVECRIKAAERFIRPTRQRRRLVVDENTTILYFRRAGGVTSG
ncbi:MAG: hypothetical protein BWY83_02730 [bacterium ADurb.Bin478]|nr:MAG: hypothetical protein BWY83_02730 [bacterium ADurb.Bin478]